MGESEEFIFKQALRAGNKIPARIENAPELEPGLDVYLLAFFDLDTERSHAMGLTQIPWSKIQRYGETYDFDDDQIEKLHYYIREMDNANLKRLEKKQKKPGKK